MNSIRFPLRILGFEFSSYDNMTYKLNKLWIIQILTCIIYCAYSNRYTPTRAKNHILIKQVYGYFVLNSMVFAFEMVNSSIFYTHFEKFMHHFLSILLYLDTVAQSQVICVRYMFPLFIHGLYWEVNGRFSNLILFLYNLSIFVATVTYDLKNGMIRLRMPFLAGLLFNVNLFSYWYDYNFNLLEVNRFKFCESFVLSVLVTCPFYFYLLKCYLHLKVEKSLSKARAFTV